MKFNGKRFPTRSKRVSKIAGVMNKTEQAYADHLQTLVLTGEVLHFDYEPESLRLAPKTFYLPDFRVIMADSTIEFHEVKACTANNDFLCEDDARVKFKIAAQVHWMYGFRMVGVRRGVVVKQECINC